MKPKPFASLNHFTLPRAIALFLVLVAEHPGLLATAALSLALLDAALLARLDVMAALFELFEDAVLGDGAREFANRALDAAVVDGHFQGTQARPTPVGFHAAEVVQTVLLFHGGKRGHYDRMPPSCPQQKRY